ncbi:MAG TPA: YhdP family protein [Burkholderiaceae bacterium]|nr:YhdP family protein [Burkholderiaceae bacterium]
MSPAPTVIASRGSLWHWSTRALRLLVGALLLLWSLLLAAWLTLYWGILPHIDEWRPRIEQVASRALRVPVRIGEIQVRSGSWIPAAELRDVVLHDSSGREALRLPRVAAALSVPSLLAFQLRFEQLLIDDAELVVRRDAKGHISFGGLEMAGEVGGDGESYPAAEWFFKQREFVIRGATVTWIDEQRGAAPLLLTDALMVVRNGLRHHDLRIDATPQLAWGERFSLRARMNQSLVSRAGDWRHWRGTLHAELPHVDVALLRNYVDLPFELREGRGALRAWLELADGQAGTATVDLALRDVALRLSRQVQPLTFEFLSARLEGVQGPQHARVSARRLTFATVDGVRWPESNFDASWRTADNPAGEAEWVAGEFGADRLDLGAMANITARVPLGEALRKALAELAPRGTVHDLVARWDGPLDSPRQYQVRARIKGLAIAAGPMHQGVGRPGWVNADVDVQANEQGGDARLAIADGAMEFPGLFAKAVVPLRRFDAQLLWRIGGAQPQGRSIDLRVKEARFDNEDARGELTMSWRTGAGAGFARGGRFPGVLELHGKLVDGRAASVARYLPLGLPDAARDYVQHSVLAGTVTNATFDVKGDLWDFPFHDARVARDGVFRIAGHAKDVVFAYVPRRSDGEPRQSWPVITQAEGDLVFDRASMTIRQAQARIFGVDLRGVDVTVRDLAHEQILEIDGQARGPLADMVRYVNESPVGEQIGGALAQASASGNADLRLALHLPLSQLDQSTVKGSVQLAGNDVRLRGDVPQFASARGRVDFTHKGVQVVGAVARTLGGELAFDGGTQADGTLRFAGQGTVTAEGMRRATEVSGLAKLAGTMQGQTAYRLQLGFVKGQTEVLLSSNLAGLALNLPAPLNKSAEASLPLRVQTSLQPDASSGNAPPRDQLRFELGSIVQALFVRELGKDGPHVLRSAVGIYAPLPTAVTGGQAVAELGTVSVDAWRAVLAGFTSAGSPADAGYLPRQITLRAREAIVAGRRFTTNVVELQRQSRDGDESWRASLQSDQAVGTVEYREPAGAGPGALNARLSRLWIATADKSVAGADPSGSASPESMPAMDVVIDDLEWRGHKLGRVELQAVNRAATGAAREWRLQRLQLRMPEATVDANGQWSASRPGAQHRMSVDFQLDLADSGALLERLGYAKTLRGGKGRLQGQLGWSGSPLSPELPSLDGQVSVALESGQVLRVDAGAARLLGVLTLQALPRRLLLDFRDVFQEGFAFDNINGDLKLAGGVAHINSLRMRGVQATVLMEGQADLERETQDLRVFVVPEINAGTASLAYAAINPAIGLGTFLAQWLLRRPLIAANTREFRITGNWDEPKVERIERKATEAAAGGQNGPSPTQ